MMRRSLALVVFLAACTLPPFGNKSPEIALPEEQPIEPIVVETRTLRKDSVKPKKPPVKKTQEEPAVLVNPLADCLNISIEDPKEAIRARLDCMQKNLNIQPEPQIEP